MFNMNEWNPVILDIVITLALLSFIFYIVVLCYSEKFQWSDQQHLRFVNRSMAFYFGVALTILANFITEHGYLGQRSSELFWNSPAPALEIRSTGGVNRSRLVNGLLDNPEKVIFVTATQYSLVQPAILTKIGQALFPVRNNAIWIVVSTTNIKDFGEQGIESDDQWNDDESTGKQDRSNETLMSMHLQTVERTLKRFGVSYVLLESHAYLNNQFHGFRVPDQNDKVVKALQTGVIWSLQNFKNGVLMLGHEEYAYNYQIFHEIRKTKVASTWPVGLGRSLGFSSPIVNKGSVNIRGYHTGSSAKWDDVVMELGAFALNIEYLRQKVDPDLIWKITWDKVYTLSSLGIKLADVEPLGENAMKILVWRTRTRQHAWPAVLKLKSYYKRTNMMKLMKNVFGLRYPSIKKYFNHTDKKHTAYL